MKEEFWLQILFVVVAIVWWLIQTIRKFRARSRQEGAKHDPTTVDHEPGPAVEDVLLSSLVDHAQIVTGRLRSALGKLESETQEVLELCREARLHDLHRVVDIAASRPTHQLLEQLSALELQGSHQDALAVLGTMQARVQTLAATVGTLRVAVLEQGQPGFPRSSGRTVAVASILLGRLESLVKKGVQEVQTPLLFPMTGARGLDPAVRRTLAEAGALAVEAQAARHPDPVSWSIVVRDLAAWLLVRIGPMHAEVSERHAGLLGELGYTPRAPDPFLLQMVFEDAVGALMLRDLWMGAARSSLTVQDPRQAEFSASVTRRVLKLAWPETAGDDAPLDVEPEILLGILLGTPLDCLGGDVLGEDLSLRFGSSDARAASEICSMLKQEQVPSRKDFSLISGAISCALEKTLSVDVLTDLVDRRLGLSLPETGDAPARRHRISPGDERFVSGQSVTEAIVLGAVLSRTRS